MNDAIQILRQFKDFSLFKEMDGVLQRLEDSVYSSQKDNKAIKKLSTEEGLEKFAREEYYMKRDNEDIYIIEYEDSLNID